MRFTLTLGIIAIAGMALAGCGEAEKTTADRIEDIAALTGNTANGEAVFADKCSVCHGPQGEGKGSTPAMSQAVDGRSDDDLFTGLIDGIGSMPAMGSQLSDQEIADVVAFIKLPN